jgi:dihydrofolate reductase
VQREMEPAIFDIVMATDSEFGIGKGGTLPWRDSKDMNHFRCLTSGKGPQGEEPVVVMGRKTWESLPIKPLPGRINIVVTSSHSPRTAPVPAPLAHERYTAPSLEYALHSYPRHPHFVIGGAQLFEEALVHPKLRRIELTQFHGDFGCDTFLRAPGLTMGTYISDSHDYPPIGPTFSTIYVGHHAGS